MSGGILIPVTFTSPYLDKNVYFVKWDNSRLHTILLHSDQTLKGNTVSVKVFKPRRWELHDFLTRNKERPPFDALYSYHFLLACCSSSCMWQRRKRPARFSTDCSDYGNAEFVHPPQMTMREPSSMKRNSRHSSHLQAVPLKPFVCSCIFHSLWILESKYFSYTLVLLLVSHLLLFFAFLHHPDKLPSALSAGTQLWGWGNWPNPYNRTHLSIDLSLCLRTADALGQ